MKKLEPPEPTAEQVIEATEGAYLLDGRRDLSAISRYMGLDVSQAHQRLMVENALHAAELLGLAVPVSNGGNLSFSVLARLLARAREAERRVLFRCHLEDYRPFSLYLDRRRAGVPPHQAASQVCAVHPIADEPLVVRRAFDDWGAFAGSLTRGDDGLLAPAGPSEAHGVLRATLEPLLVRTEDARTVLLRGLGPSAWDFVSGDVRDQLAEAILMASSGRRLDSVVLKAGNAYESFLRAVGPRCPGVQNAKGISQIGNELRNQRLIARKHQGAIDMIAQVRNANDHGGDPDEGNRTWQISLTAVQVMLAALVASMRSIVAYRTGGGLEL